jgi:glycyl-tRNA synthetase beta chain
LSKADLQSRLVNEFPELQGTAGRYYAAAKGEAPEVAAAIDEAYMPRFSGDAIAPSKLGQVLAIAERLDTLAGGFAPGLKPTGNKDPFSLRRNALGLARTLLEGGHELSVSELVTRALEAQPIKAQSEQAQDFSMFEICEEFIYERLRSYYSDQDIPVVQFEAVNNVAHGSLPDFDRRLKAIGEFAKLPEAEALAAANKRIRNILRKVEGAIPTGIDPALFTEAAERELFDAVEQAITDTDEALKSRDYVAALGRLAHLRPQVDAFFDAVMVNVDDVMVRNNRLALLARLDRMGTQVADISVLQSA